MVKRRQVKNPLLTIVLQTIEDKNWWRLIFFTIVLHNVEAFEDNNGGKWRKHNKFRLNKLENSWFFLRVWKSRINNKECHLSALVLQALEAFEDWEATNDDKLKMIKIRSEINKYWSSKPKKFLKEVWYKLIQNFKNHYIQHSIAQDPKTTLTHTHNLW